MESEKLNGHNLSNVWELSQQDFNNVMDGFAITEKEEAEHEKDARTLYFNTIIELYNQYQQTQQDFKSFADAVRIAYSLGVADGHKIR